MSPRKTSSRPSAWSSQRAPLGSADAVRHQHRLLEIEQCAFQPRRVRLPQALRKSLAVADQPNEEVVRFHKQRCVRNHFFASLREQGGSTPLASPQSESRDQRTEYQRSGRRGRLRRKLTAGNHTRKPMSVVTALGDVAVAVSGTTVNGVVSSTSHRARHAKTRRWDLADSQTVDRREPATTRPVRHSSRRRTNPRTIPTRCRPSRKSPRAWRPAGKCPPASDGPRGFQSGAKFSRVARPVPFPTDTCVPPSRGPPVPIRPPSAAGNRPRHNTRRPRTS